MQKSDDAPHPCFGVIQAATKTGALIELMRRPQGATMDDLTNVTGWLPHSVRGAIAGTLKKRRGLKVVHEKEDGRRVYRIIDGGEHAERG